MDTLTFREGSIGARLYNQASPAHDVPIAIPREFAAGRADFARTEGDGDRWVHGVMATGVVLALAAIVYLVV